MVSGMLAVIIVIVAPLCVCVCVCVCVCAQSRPTLCGLRNCKPTRLLCHGPFQARLLERDAISYSRRSSQPRDQMSLESPALAGKLFTTGASLEAQYFIIINSHSLSGFLVQRTIPPRQFLPF